MKTFGSFLVKYWSSKYRVCQFSPNSSVEKKRVSYAVFKKLVEALLRVTRKNRTRREGHKWRNDHKTTTFFPIPHPSQIRAHY